MRYKNKRTEEKLVLGTQYLNQNHLTSADVFATVLVFCDVDDITDIV